jgi:hypothetical protein
LDAAAAALSLSLVATHSMSLVYGLLLMVALLLGCC